MMNVLLIDQDLRLARRVQSLLKQYRSGFRFEQSYIAGLNTLKTQVCDCVVISADLTDSWLLHRFGQIPARHPGMTVIVFSHLLLAEELCTLYDFSGDIIGASFDFEQLRLRLRLLIKSRSFRVNTEIRAGNLVVQENGLIYVSGKLVSLSRTETLILTFLLEKRNEVLSLKSIHTHILAGGTVKPFNYGRIDAHVSKINQRLAVAGLVNCLVNVKGKGYTFRNQAVAEGDSL